MNGVTVCLESGGAVSIPLQQQRPQIRVLFAEKTKLVNALIVAEPAPPLVAFV